MLKREEQDNQELQYNIEGMGEKKNRIQLTGQQSRSKKQENKSQVTDQKRIAKEQKSKVQETGKKSRTKEQQNEECIICYEKFNQKIVVICEHCKHKQCKRCTQKYLNKGQVKCPLCREDWCENFIQQNKLKTKRKQGELKYFEQSVQLQEITSSSEQDENRLEDISQLIFFEQPEIFEGSDGYIYVLDEKIEQRSDVEQEEQPQILAFQNSQNEQVDNMDYIRDQIQIMLQTLTISGR